jgi:hypothetical protein
MGGSRPGKYMGNKRGYDNRCAVLEWKDLDYIINKYYRERLGVP